MVLGVLRVPVVLWILSAPPWRQNCDHANARMGMNLQLTASNAISSSAAAHVYRAPAVGWPPAGAIMAAIWDESEYVIFSCP
jgi:hypothetical protein